MVAIVIVMAVTMELDTAMAVNVAIVLDAVMELDTAMVMAVG